MPPNAPSRLVPPVVATAVLFLLIGLWLGGHPNDLPGPIRDAFVGSDDAVRSQLMSAIEDNYYKRVSTGTLEQASLNGIVASLHDPYSEYFTPSETKQFDEGLGGEFTGIGIAVEGTRQGLRVDQVYPSSPAQHARLRPGDVIVRVDGRSIAGEPVEVASRRIQGPAGTSVTLGVRSPGAAAVRIVTLKRAQINIPVVSGRIVTAHGTRVADVVLSTFSSGAHVQLRRQVESLLRRGARAIVLDLRHNGGGLLDEGVAVSSLFVQRGLIVSTRGRTKPTENHYALGGAIDSRVPVAVLVDGDTASAAEITAGALRDHRRATVVGTKTFGKGVFQEIEPLSNHGELKLTVGSYYLPDDENLAGHGIEPAVRVQDDPSTPRDEALNAAVALLLRKLR